MRLETLESRILLSRLAYTAADGVVAEDSAVSPYMVPQHYLYTPGGYLSGPSKASALSIAQGGLAANAGKLGLTSKDILNAVVTDQYRDADTGLTHIYLAQRLNGLKVQNTTMTVTVAADGRILNIAGGFVSNVAQFATLSAIPKKSMLDALSAATALLLPDSSPTVLAAQTGQLKRGVLSDKGLSLDPIVPRLAYMATGTGIELVWNMPLRTPDGNHWYDFNVDANTGQAAESFDWADHATYNVYPQPTEAPNDGSRAVLTDPYDPAASPFGWQDTNGVAGPEFTDTRGNNVSAQEDVDANDTGGFRPSGGASLNFDFPIDLTQAPSTYQSAAITNLFYWNNLSHDLHYKYGFTEAAGNFQVTNYSGQGLGNDAVQADAQDGSGTNNANFFTPPDGQAPRMQMYLFNSTSPMRDGDLDALVIVHEYGHGVSNRLTGGPSIANTLSAIQSGGMGEGWSDWWSLMFTQKPTDTQTAAYPVGTYVLGQTTSGPGIRRYPYSYDMTKDPLTISNYNTDASHEVHNTGEIWATTLWDMNWLLVSKYGFNANLAQGYTGAGSAGNILALKLVMDALKIQPSNPSFKDARDAILQADQVLTGGANQYEIWSAFARRGMGYSFVDSSSSSTSVTAAFDLPPGLLAPSVVSQTPTGVTTSAVNAIDLTFSKAMDTSSFDINSDVVSFTGPGGVDLKPQLTGFSWTNSNQTLHLTLNSQTLNGAYSLVVGPNILAASDGKAMDQNHNGTSGEAGDTYTATFRYDALVGQVTSTNPANNTLATLPLTTIDVTFNEAYLPGSLSASDLQVNQGTVTGVTPTGANTAQFALSGLTTEGTLNLTIAAGAITDSAGNPFASYSGTLFLDVANGAFPTLTQKGTAGTLIYDGSVNGTVGNASDTDSYTLTLDAGQVLTVLATGSAGLRPHIEVRDAGNALVGSADAAAANGVALLETLPTTAAGVYTVTIGGVGGTSGSYTLKATLNAALEGEENGGGTNDTIGTAQSLDGGFVSPVAGAAIASVVGKMAGPTGTQVFADDFETGSLGAAWSTYQSNPTTGRIQVTGAQGTAAGSYALIMDNNDPAAAYNLNEAVWTVNMTGVASPTLSFSTIALADETDVLPTSFVGHVNGDGVSISADGTNWRTIWTNSSPSTWTTVTVDLAAAAAAAGIVLGPNFKIKFQQYDNFDAPTDGRGYDSIAITSPALQKDYYTFTLGAGESATVGLKKLSAAASNLDLKFVDSVGNVLAWSTAATSYDRLLRSFVAPAAGNYGVLVTGDQAADYALTVTKNMELSSEPNNAPGGAQAVLTAAPTGELSAVGYVSGANPADVYAVVLTAGTQATFRTSTPAGGSGQFTNNLNPRLRLLTSNGTQLAIDLNSDPDGRNAVLTYTPATTTTYWIEVSHESSTAGEYALSVTGAQPNFNGMQKSGITPSNGSTISVVPASATVTFVNPILVTTLQAGDLLLDGAPATGVSMTDDHTAVFTLPAVGPGMHTFTMAAGALTDIRNFPVSAFSSTFTLDLTPPVVTASTMQEGDTRTPGANSVAVTFSKAMLASNLDTSDITLHGNLRNVNYTPSTLSYSPGNLQLNLSFSSLPEDSYTLTLLSGNGRFEDANGLDLDGEPNFPIPPNTSGNGVAGGNFVVNFMVDGTTAAMPTPLTSIAPLGSAIYTGSTTAVVNTGTDTDTFTVMLDAGQTLTVVTDPTTVTLRPSVTVTGPGGTLGTATAAGAGQDAVIQTVPAATAGQYSITVSSAASTTGLYTVQAYVNSAVESEQHNGPTNDTQATAQSLDPAMLSLPGGAAEAGVVGTLGASTSDYYAVTLSAGQSLSLALTRLTTSNAITLGLYDASGNLLTPGLTTATNVQAFISRFVAPLAGTNTYYVKVSGSSMDYSLVATRNAIFDLENNGTRQTGQVLGPGATAMGYVESGGADFYSVYANAGDQLTVKTFRPGGGAQEFVNSLDPAVDLYDANGVNVATDNNSDPNGVDALLSYAVPSSGIYSIRVRAAVSGTGEYGLTVSGGSIVPTPLTVSSITPTNGTSTSTVPTQATVVFSNPLLLTSVAAADLKLDGTPVPSFSVVGDHTITFNLPAGIGLGPHTLSINAGDVQDIYGGTLGAFSSGFTVIAGPATHFDWSPVADAQVGVPFGATITARDANGNIATSYNGQPSISGLVGTGTTSSLLITEMYVGTPDAIEFTNVGSAPLNISGWHVYIYDVDFWPAPRTTLFSFPAGTTVQPGGIVVLQEFGTAPGTSPTFFTGENIDWTSGAQTAVLVTNAASQMIDFAAASAATPGSITNPGTIPASQWQGAAIPATANESNSYSRFVNSDNNNASDWHIVASTIGTLNSGLATPFPGGSSPISISPTTATFVNGVWTGNITVQQGASNMYLRVDDGGGHVNDSNTFNVTVDSTPPVVTGVYVSSSSWTAAFFNYLATSGNGSATFGYRMPTGSQQLNALPFANVDRISIQFSENVDLGAAVASLTGGTSGAYALSNFTFDTTTHTASWTIDRPLAGEVLQLSLTGNPKDGANNALDGEWVDGVSTVSGNGTAGGSFAFQMRLLGGDANGDGVTNFADFVIISNNYGQPNKGIAGGDMNGDGVTNFADYVILSNNYGKTVPAITTLVNPAALNLISTTAYAPAPKAAEPLEVSSELPGA